MRHLLRSPALALLVATFAAASAGCDCAGGPTPGTCTTSTDCRAGQSCIDGRCRATPDAGPLPDAGPGNDADRPDAVVVPDTGLDGGPTCAGVTCDPGERCAIVAGAPSCVPNTCADLACSVTERCEPAPVGMGNVCVDISCTDAIDCAPDEYCNGTICVADLCTAGVGTCDAMSVSVCVDDGSTSTVRYTCGSTTHFTSSCTTDARGAYCPCEDDWDCPANTRCEVGRCEGTGVAPTCRLAPQPFTSVLPTNEITWGGVSAAMHDAVGRPFPPSAQVSATPVVVNLDDDTGDGRIDELDIPEIVFQTYCGTDVSTNGALRAIHGGGTHRGEDFFAVMGPTVWHEGDPLPATTTCANGDLNSTSGIAAGDLDGDGVPEIVAITEGDGVAILSNTGTRIATSATALWPAGYVDPTPAIANLDHAGLPEIVVGRVVLTIRRDPGMPIVFQDTFSGALMSGQNGQGPISCLGDVAGGDELEVVAGSTVYRLPTPPAGVTRRSMCAVGDTSNFCGGRLDVVWDGQTVNGATLVPTAQRDGFCALADVLGVDPVAAPGPTNPLDGQPEVVLVANGYLVVYSGDTGVRRRFINLGAGTDGGAPNVDDFDGDGFPEVGTAFGLRYIAIDLQAPTAACPAWPNAFNDAMTGLQGNPMRTPPATACTADADCGDPQFACNETIGRCVCFHNGWMRITEDDSSRVTGSTVFDFNGDGGAEIVYNDECYFRVYDGVNGTVLFRGPSSSRTRVENPVVADVDNDGNAEIVFPSNNDASACSVGETNNGIEVWGDASDSWVSARRIWNEHAYHVTNVLESSGVPSYEPQSWLTYAGRSYDTYRSQPRSAGVAPDLVIDRVQASSPDAACGTLGTMLDIVVRVVNRGDLRVGPDVMVALYGEWPTVPLSEALHADALGTPLSARLGTTLEPGASTLVSVRYVAANNSPGVLPAMIRVVVDDAMAERECVETNNTVSIAVDPGSTAPDLAVDLGATGGVCPAQTFVTTIENVGSAAASDVVVRYYVGDPAAGGLAIHDEVFPGVLAPGASMMRTVTINPFPMGPLSIVHAVVDPDDVVAECNDGNNDDQTANRVGCQVVI